MGSSYHCFFPYGTEQDEKVYITEGLATAATIFSLTGIKTLATFGAGNLKQLSIDIRKNYPNIKIVICADDDWMTAGNPGISKAVEAAKAKAEAAVAEHAAAAEVAAAEAKVAAEAAAAEREAAAARA